MSNQIADTQNADGQKKIYEAPQIQDLDTIDQTKGKNFLGPGELDSYTGTVVS